ncbi:tail fiber assembly protein [Rosenbergiella australiborealis]|uniref:tail fiber assembly protein n=1 Tax=Rosenbergiella australiborealis TaxID=1544696 RepID=UPI001F4E71F1|nr:tail fiber assembly protein [Rosenbergiella australiborealis]
MKTIYVSTLDYRSFAAQEIDGWPTIPVEVPGDFSGGAKKYDPKTNTWTDDVIPQPTQEQLNTGKRDSLIIQAQQVSSDWNTDLLLGIATDDEKQKLINMRQYIKQLQALDMTKSDITWPDMPAT